MSARLRFLHHHHRPRQLHSFPTTHKNPAVSPSPPLKDMGSTTNVPATAVRVPAATAPPLSKGMWAALVVQWLLLFDGGFGEGETQRGTQEVGGPCGTSGKRTTMEVVVRFRQFLIPSHPTDHPCAQRQHIERRDLRLPQQRPYEPNGGDGSRATR